MMSLLGLHTIFQAPFNSVTAPESIISIPPETDTNTSRDLKSKIEKKQVKPFHCSKSIAGLWTVNNPLPVPVGEPLSQMGTQW